MNARNLLPIIAIALMMTVIPVKAFVLIESPPEEAEDEPAQSKQEPVKAHVPPPQVRAMALISRTPNMHVDPSSLKVLGCWIGNIQCRVASDRDGRLFVVDRDGRPYDVPAGVKPEEIAIPEHNVFVDSMLASQPIASEETQVRMLDQKDDGVAHFVNGPKPPLMPVMMATRSVSVNGKTLILGGAIISELPNWKEELKKQKRKSSNSQARKRSK